MRPWSSSDGRIAYAGPARCCRPRRPARDASTPAAARSCRGWSRRISIRPISTSPRSKTSTSSIRSNTSRCWPSVNARLALECGYTAARSGGSLFNIDVWLKKAIENDLVPGPRLAASGREICGVGGLMDWNPDFRKIGMEGWCCSSTAPTKRGPPCASWSRTASNGSRPIPTGDAAAPDTNDHHTLCMTFEEMHAVVATAHNHGLKVTGHCRATAGNQERPAGRLRRARARHLHGRRGAGHAAGARRARSCRRSYFELASIERGPEFGMSQRVIDGHKETLEGGADSAGRILEGRRPARHGRRLRLRLEPARRLRQGADASSSTTSASAARG